MKNKPIVFLITSLAAFSMSVGLEWRLQPDLDKGDYIIFYVMLILLLLAYAGSMLSIILGIIRIVKKRPDKLLNLLSIFLSLLVAAGYTVYSVGYLFHCYDCDRFQ